MNLERLFEDELRRHGLPFKLDPASGRYAIQMAEGESLVSLENLRRDVEKDGDAGRVTRFVEAIVAANNMPDDGLVLVPGTERLRGEGRDSCGNQ